MYQTYGMQWRLGRGEFKPLNAYFKKKKNRDFPGGPVVENLPSNTGYVGLIHGQETKRATASEPEHLH